MKRRFVRLFAGLLTLLLTAGTALAAPEISAEKAILMDAASGRVLYEKRADERSLIASTTKIMTAVVAAEQCALDAKVRIPAAAVGVEGSSMYLREGEVLTVQELLYGLLLCSGNDAAVALALHCAGSVEEFAGRMNDKALALGLTGTHFVNPNGLDAQEHYSTARDLARLAAYAMQNDTLRAIAATKRVTIGSRQLTNHNRLLWSYDGAVGVKTGYTRAAGRILVSAAERGDRRLIAVTIRDPNDWADHRTLLDYGFGCFQNRQVLAAGEPVGEVPLLTGGSARLTAAEDFSYPLLPEECVERRLLAPPVAWDAWDAGSAELVLTLDGRQIGRVRLNVEEGAGDAGATAKNPVSIWRLLPPGGGGAD